MRMGTMRGPMVALVVLLAALISAAPLQAEFFDPDVDRAPCDIVLAKGPFPQP